MRQHGHARIDPRHPQALGICDRCGRMDNLRNLSWQYDWQFGPRLKNLRILCCASCLDRPQESGRTIVLPPDPVPVMNARPENYANADNPLSPLGYNVIDMFVPGSSLGANIGTMTQNAGLDAAFAQAPLTLQSTGTSAFTTVTTALVNKPFGQSAAKLISDSSFGNTVGKNWNGNADGTTISLPSTVAAITHTVSSATAYAPNDMAFLRSGATGWLFQGSNDGATWTTLSSGTTAGTVAETLGFTPSGGAYGYHRFALQGDGISNVAVAGLVISVSDAAANEI
jgi:hypothetical protein